MNTVKLIMKFFATRDDSKTKRAKLYFLIKDGSNGK